MSASNVDRELRQNTIGIAVDLAMTHPPGATSEEIARKANALTRNRSHDISADAVDITLSLSGLSFSKDEHGRWCIPPPTKSSSQNSKQQQQQQQH